MGVSTEMRAPSQNRGQHRGTAEVDPGRPFSETDLGMSAVPPSPCMLEIEYVRGKDGERHAETVYEDPEGEDHPPRLLVSLKAVTSLKALCDHEHAKYDKTVKTLEACRGAYFKELCWLRDQLHLAYRTDADAQARRANLTYADFEVYFFDPPRFLDEEMRDFVRDCIRENNRRLIKENEELKLDLAKVNLLQTGAVKTVLRHLRTDGNAASKILRDLHGLLRTKEDLQDFDDEARRLVKGVETADEAAKKLAVNTEDRSCQALQDEVKELKRRADEDKALIDSLRGKLANSVDAEIERGRANAERERADAERRRADMVVQRAERLEEQYRELQLELQASPCRSVPVNPRHTSRLQKSVTQLTKAFVGLSPSSATTKPLATSLTSPLGSDDTTFDDALSHLDEVAAGFDRLAVGVQGELHQLRSRLREAEADVAAAKAREDAAVAEAAAATAAKVAVVAAEQRSCRTPRKDSIVSNGGVSDATVAVAAADERAAKAAAAAAAAEVAVEAASRRAANAEEALSNLRAELLGERSRGDSCKTELEEERRRHEESREIIAKMEARMYVYVTLVDRLKAKIRNLRLAAGENPNEDDDEDEEVSSMIDFLTPYRTRVAMGAGKQRWQLLSEDAKFRRKKREYLTCENLFIYERTAPAETEVTEAFAFLRRNPEVGELREAQQPALGDKLPSSARPASVNRGGDIFSGHGALVRCGVQAVSPRRGSATTTTGTAGRRATTAEVMLRPTSAPLVHLGAVENRDARDHIAFVAEAVGDVSFAAAPVATPRRQPSPQVSNCGGTCPGRGGAGVNGSDIRQVSPIKKSSLPESSPPRISSKPLRAAAHAAVGPMSRVPSNEVAVASPPLGACSRTLSHPRATGSGTMAVETCTPSRSPPPRPASVRQRSRSASAMQFPSAGRSSVHGLDAANSAVAAATNVGGVGGHDVMVSGIILTPRTASAGTLRPHSVGVTPPLGSSARRSNMRKGSQHSVDPRLLAAVAGVASGGDPLMAEVMPALPPPRSAGRPPGTSGFRRIPSAALQLSPLPPVGA